MKSNRMFGILSILLDRKQVTAKELAEYFEVSVRTIHRDLLDLSSAGFPITTQQGIGGGISLMPNFKYNKSVLNTDNLYITFHSEYPSWVITTFASLGDKAEIVSPDSLRSEIKNFLKNTISQYET